jgi:hypothetical protein
MREYEVILSEIEVGETDPKSKLAGVDGYVLIKVPNYVERLKMMEAQGLSGSADGTNLKTIIKVVETCNKFIVNVDCSIDGEKITSFEDLGVFQKGCIVINHIFSILAGGIPSKKN